MSRPPAGAGRPRSRSLRPPHPDHRRQPGSGPGSSRAATWSGGAGTEYGSVSENTGFPYDYAASKAALNTLMHSLAAEARRHRITTVLLDPGWVSTDMGGPEAPVTPAQSVAAMIRVIDGLTARHNGGFFITREGREAPW